MYAASALSRVLRSVRLAAWTTLPDVRISYLSVYNAIRQADVRRAPRAFHLTEVNWVQRCFTCRLPTDDEEREEDLEGGGQDGVDERTPLVRESGVGEPHGVKQPTPQAAMSTTDRG
jgi:hypothetical protein